jgi:hypothetical protein
MLWHAVLIPVSTALVLELHVRFGQIFLETFLIIDVTV